MSLLLYGIIAEDVVIDLGCPLWTINVEGLAAIVMTLETEISREPTFVLAYGERVTRLHQQTTLIPMRYGSVLADKSAVEQHLLEQQVHYQARLNALDNCEEIGVRLLIDDTAEAIVTSVPVSGFQYLLARKHAYELPASVEQQVDLLNTALAGFYRQHSAEQSVFNGQRTYLLSYLVPRAQLETFFESLTAVLKTTKESITVSGPWPPYNFIL